MITDLELGKLESKAKFSGWSSIGESAQLVLRLIGEIRELKKANFRLDSVSYMQSLDKRIDEHECVVVEIETLKNLMPKDTSPPLDEYVDSICAQTKWESIINYSTDTVMFYKDKAAILLKK